MSSEEHSHTKDNIVLDVEKSTSKLLKNTLKNVPRRTHAATIDAPLRVTGYGLDKSVSGLKIIKDDGTDVLDSVIKHATHMTFDSEENKEKQDIETNDLAKSKYMMKNIANLLTTASLYSGLDNAQNVNELASPLESNKRLDLPKQHDSASAPLDIVPYKLTERKPTLFEISVTSKNPSSSNLNIDKPKEIFGRNIIDTTTHNEKVTLKLQAKFELDSDEHFIFECTSWILKDVLIQGRLFLTTRHLLFYALLPKNSEDKVTMTGNLNVKSRIKGLIRYWCILKGTVLSLYTSPSDIYFPVLTIDLRNVSTIDYEPSSSVSSKTLTLVTTDKNKYKFLADSDNSAKTWFKALKRQQFTTTYSSQNSLRITIPLANILYIDDETIVREALTLGIRVLEGSEDFVMDDYMFMFLDKEGYVLKDKLLVHLKLLKQQGQDILFDDSPVEDINIEHPFNSIMSQHSPKKTLSPETSHLTKSSRLGRLRSKSSSWLHRRHHNVKRHNVEESLVIESNFNRANPNDIGESFLQDEPNVINRDMPIKADKEHDTKGKLSSWTVRPFKNVSEMWNAKPLHYPNAIFKFDDSSTLIKDNDCKSDNEKFRDHFNLSDTQYLIASYFTYLNRNVPIYGKLYIGNESICFRSLIPGSKTIMILPHIDIQSCYTEKGVRLGYFIIVLVIDSHNELFFEFSSEPTRDDAMKIISHIVKANQVLITKTKDKSNKELSVTNFIESNPEHAKLKFFEDKISQTGIDIPLIIDHNPYYSTHIKPNKSYNIAMLTIGSRGDVQPYIAFGKGLIKEGHKVTIITHKEFKEFVEVHGISFKEIAGNPAELMSLMVEHESMNLGLLKDASSRFSGWIAELLQTSWVACKEGNFDILIESPSAMAGIHIAEALDIAYFRAFTMPWTRTRAYPHAFIVPDQNRGGNYNYLTHVLFENIFWKGICGQVNKWRVENLGLKKTNLDLLQQNKVPFLYNVSPTIFPPSVDFSEWVKVTGYWFLDEKHTYDPPKELVEFINKARKVDKKLVYIGFGSIVVSNAKEMTKALIEAVITADVYCVLNKGWSDRLGDTSSEDLEVELPECIYNAGSVPHDWLFPHMDAAVHHGGSGTIGASLRAGLPTIVKPFFGDQFFYANQVEAIGAGIALKKFNASTLAIALKEVTTNMKMKDKAKIIQNQIAHEDGVQTAINCIYSELEYSRGLISAKHKQNKIVDSNALVDIEKITHMGITDVSGLVSSVISTVNPIDTSMEDSWILL